jgi:hypothetical protein
MGSNNKERSRLYSTLVSRNISKGTRVLEIFSTWDKRENSGLESDNPMGKTGAMPSDFKIKSQRLACRNKGFIYKR